MKAPGLIKKVSPADVRVRIKHTTHKLINCPGMDKLQKMFINYHFEISTASLFWISR